MFATERITEICVIIQLYCGALCGGHLISALKRQQKHHVCRGERERKGESNSQREICRADAARYPEIDVHVHVRLDIHL